MVIAKRARSHAQKTERRQYIMAAATELIREKPFHAISMADVAHQAGVAKGSANSTAGNPTCACTRWSWAGS
jgi:AcrR family transcriptional regulator